MLNLKPDEFWDMSWSEFWMLHEGWTIRKQYEWEHTRFIAAEIRTAAFGAKRATKPTQIMNLPEIDKRNMPVFKPEEHQKFLEQMSRMAGLPAGQLIQLQKAQDN